MNASTPAVRSRSAKPSPYATGFTPCAASQSWLAGPAMPITSAPVRLASWTTIDPTPPAAPDTATVSPGFGDTARTEAYAVHPATANDPPTSHETFAGLVVRFCASTITYSAWLARPSVKPITSSPAANPSTPGPLFVTIPARSLPSPDGNVAGHLARRSPSRIFASPGLIDAALTLTSTCPGPGSVTGTSATRRTSTPPYSSNRTAFDILHSFAPIPDTTRTGSR